MDNKSKKPSSLEKRIKRNIVGRRHHFFVAAAPGLKKLCFDELSDLEIEDSDIKLVDGGVEFSGRLHDCYLANLHLRYANRIVMRIAEFKATSFRDLEKKLKNIPWELYLGSTVKPEIKASIQKSRLYHSDAVTGHVEKSIVNNEIIGAIPKTCDEQKKQLILVRGVEDRFTISVDSSGELLYRRGLKRQGGRAPIRETIAAAALKLAGYDVNKPLVDPMCGSGTFSIEAAMIKSRMPSGWNRDFAFMEWPSFRNGRWEHIRKKAAEQISSEMEINIHALDKESGSVEAFKEMLNETGFNRYVSLSNHDFFDTSPDSLGIKEKGLVIINPPYGLRIGTRKESDSIFSEIFTKLKKDYPGWKAGIIATRQNLDVKIPVSFSSHPFSHGGLKLFLLTGNIPG